MVESATASAGLGWLCVGIAVAIAAALPGARYLAGRRAGETAGETHRATALTAAGVLAWMGLTGGLAGAGVLDAFSTFPPPLLPVMFGGVILTLVVALSRFGKRLALELPLALLVGYQAFRIAVELMLHRAGVEGVIGMHMTWSGLNFDVVTGITALGLGLWLAARREAEPPRALLWAWNLMGLALVAIIVAVAIMSMPGPLRRFGGPANVWVGTLPFVWLPTMMVTAALFGHLLVLRRLLAR